MRTGGNHAKSLKEQHELALSQVERFKNVESYMNDPKRRLVKLNQKVSFIISAIKIVWRAFSIIDCMFKHVNMLFLNLSPLNHIKY